MSNRRRLRPGPYRQRLRESVTAVAPGDSITLDPPPTPARTTGVRLHETIPSLAAEAPKPQTGPLLIPVVLIEAGWNKARTRYYPADVLARDIPTVFPAGTHMYFDHPSQSEQVDQPERSLTRLAAVLTKTPEPSQINGRQVMVSEARVFAPFRTALTEMWQHIGVSINADGTGDYGERDGHRGLIIESIDYGRSVDFVTRAGAGGRILALVEAAREATLVEKSSIGARAEAQLHSDWTVLADRWYAEGRLTRAERITMSSAVGDALTAWVSRVERDAPNLYWRDLWDDPTPPPTAMVEAATEDIRRALSAVLTATYGGEDTWVWVRDFDPDRALVWYEVTADGADTLWQEGYHVDGGVLSLTGGRVRVLARTVYTPTQPDSDGTGQTRVVEADHPTPPHQPNPGPGSPPDTPPTHEQETEGVMPEPTPEQLREAETARDTALREAAEARTIAAQATRELAQYRAADAARPIANTLLAESELPSPAQHRVLATINAATIPLTESFTLDEAAFRTRIQAEIAAEGAYLAQLRENAGEGQVRGAAPTTTGLTAPTPVDPDRVRQALIESYTARGMSPEAAKLAASGRPF